MPWDVDAAVRADAVLVHGLADMSPAMERIEHVIVEAIDHRFAEQSDGSEAWAPLAASTVEERARLGYGPTPILERTGTLRGSIKSSHDRESAEAGPSEDVAYAGAHADGTEDGRIPRRDFLTMTDDDIARADEAIAAHLEAAEGGR